MSSRSIARARSIRSLGGAEALGVVVLAGVAITEGAVKQVLDSLFASL